MKKKIRTTTVVLIITCILEIAFTIFTFLAAWSDVNIPSALITYWHITFVGELLGCAGIKVAKVLKSSDGDDSTEGDAGEDENAIG